jgi:hypothetical protein
MHAQNTIIARKCIPKKTKHFQQSFPEPSHSLKIVLRRTICGTTKKAPSQSREPSFFAVNREGAIEIGWSLTLFF